MLSDRYLHCKACGTDRADIFAVAFSRVGSARSGRGNAWHLAVFMRWNAMENGVWAVVSLRRPGARELREAASIDGPAEVRCQSLKGLGSAWHKRVT